MRTAFIGYSFAYFLLLLLEINLLHYLTIYP